MNPSQEMAAWSQRIRLAKAPVHPTQFPVTIHHALGIDEHTIFYNHLNRPRELVQAEPVLGLFT